MSDRYGVIGYPIAHSKSPMIHAAFAQATHQDLVYEAILGPENPPDFAQKVDSLRIEGFKGLNVTLPFKLEAFAYAQKNGRLTQRATQAQAVNTLLFDGERVLGDNTDGQGLVQDITLNHACPLKDKRILILGAGGAVQGVLNPILAHHPAEILIANRTLSKAENLAKTFGVKAASFDSIAGPAFDIIINGTSASLSGDVPPIDGALIDQRTFCYDMLYAAQPTAFMAWAKAQGSLKQADGLGMLIEQAAQAFSLWRGVYPETLSILQKIRASMR